MAWVPSHKHKATFAGRRLVQEGGWTLILAYDHAGGHNEPLQPGQFPTPAPVVPERQWLCAREGGGGGVLQRQQQLLLKEATISTMS